MREEMQEKCKPGKGDAGRPPKLADSYQDRKLRPKAIVLWEVQKCRKNANGGRPDNAGKNAEKCKPGKGDAGHMSNKCRKNAEHAISKSENVEKKN